MSCASVPPSVSHEGLRFGLMSAGRRMLEASERPDGFLEARDGLVEFCAAELLPHLERDERWLIEAQRCVEGGLLAHAMRAEIRTMTAAVYELPTVTGACEAMALTRVLHTFLAAHDHHEQLLRAASSTD